MSDNVDTGVDETNNYKWQKKYGILCVICNKIYTKKFIYDKHYNKYHPGHAINFTCTLCKKTIDEYNKFRNHCYRHLIQGRYKCDLCDKIFSQKCHLNNHVQSLHENSIICKVCNSTYETLDSLNKHIQNIHGNTETEYKCEQCNKVLHSSTGYRVHLKTHKLGRHFMCDLCGVRFTQKANLEVHVKNHYNLNPLACSYCSKTFLSQAKLKDHKVKHTNVREYTCEICNKSYKTERYMKIHFKRHSSAATFLCNVCNKGFYSSTKLREHIYIHTGEKPYKCKYCVMAFTNFPNWMKHIRNKHKVDHKTGEPLNNNIKQNESNSTQLPKSLTDTLTNVENISQPHLINIMNVSDENLLNFPWNSQEIQGKLDMIKEPNDCQFSNATDIEQELNLANDYVASQVDSFAFLSESGLQF